MSFHDGEGAHSYLNKMKHVWGLVFSNLNIWDGMSCINLRVACLTIRVFLLNCLMQSILNE